MEGLWENLVHRFLVHRCSGFVGTRGYELVSKSWGLREGYQEAMCDRGYRM